MALMRNCSDDDSTMTRSHRTLALLTSFGLTALVSAQAKPQLTLATVLERGPALAASLPTILWFPSGHVGTVVLPSKDGGQAMHRLKAGRPAKTPWFTAEDVVAVLPMDSSKAPKRFPPMTWLDQDTLRLQYDHSIWHWDIGAKQAARVLSWRDPKGTLLELSPNDGHAAVRSAHQLFLHDRSGEKHQLSFDGSEDVVIGGPAHRSEIGIVKGTFWRDDGRFLAFYREDLRPITRYPYQDVQLMPPKPRHGRYPMAGRPHSKVRVLVCDTETYQVATLWSDPD
ncbi:MAG: dipeptidyl-peptidase-4, partial [Planctomycetota bacterium]